MHCPRCGQEQVNEQIRFCPRCGFLLTGIAEIVANGGVNPEALQASGAKPISARKRGIKQGLFIFLLTFLVVPIISILTVWANAEPFAVAISAILLFVGGLLRMAYALMFESPNPNDTTLEQKVLAGTQQFLNKRQNANALPPQQSIPVDSYVPPTQGNWRDTNDLAPNSVTDSTTKLLQEEGKRN
jgi:hypothetical protein